MRHPHRKRAHGDKGHNFGRFAEVGKMTKIQSAWWGLGLAIWLALVAGIAVGQSDAAKPGEAQGETPDTAPQERGLVIDSDSDLPEANPQGRYALQLQAHGGISTPHWRLEKGRLPPGIRLLDGGMLLGKAEQSGEFQFTLSVTDGGGRGVQKEFLLRVVSAMSLTWKAGAQVNGNRIEGSAQVTNTTADDIDLTFDVMAVAPNGRATAIGYQHFVLRRGANAVELPFGETLPRGGYAIHVDAVGEVARKKLIYREYLDTPGRLQVTVGP
jgi:hypothetical protein